MRKEYWIYPAIGVARIGSSESGYFIGPETPKLDFQPPNGLYRDDEGRIKRQGARFRIYELTFNSGAEPSSVRELSGGEATIEWTVHLVNAKASQDGLNSEIPRDELLIDPGGATIQGRGEAHTLTGNIQGIRVKLGDLLTDEHGRLVVLGGHGVSGAWNDPGGGLGLYNDGWYDDVSDGRVTARIKFNSSNEWLETTSASWVVVGVPDFAHPIENIVTLFDLMVDAGRRLETGRKLEIDRPVSFTKDVFPILHRAELMRWVSQTLPTQASTGVHDFITGERFERLWKRSIAGGADEKRNVFARLKPPTGSGIGISQDMPRLIGLSLTTTQYELLKRWSEGDFEEDWTGISPQPDLETLPAEEQPEALTRAALEGCVGGSFQPGIEVSAIVADPALYKTPFRIADNIQPGFLTRDLSVPWQADFTYCGTGWWPGGRPNFVQDESENGHRWIPRSMDARTLVTEWAKLGFIKQEGGLAGPYREHERKL